METWTTTTPEESALVGRKLATRLAGGEVICLSGELGSGKTTFTKGLAAALGVTGELTSPTFMLMNIYQLPATNYQLQKLIHIDTYRLENESELIAIGAQDYIGAPGTVTVIEWPEKLTTLLHNKKIIAVHFEHTQNNGRKITIK